MGDNLYNKRAVIRALQEKRGKDKLYNNYMALMTAIEYGKGSNEGKEEKDRIENELTTDKVLSIWEIRGIKGEE